MIIDSQINPWVGLSSYEYEDAFRFFGREKEIDELCALIRNNTFTTIYGISGAGKTSLINAGLIPNLEKENYLPIRVRLEHESSIGYCSQMINAIKDALLKVDGEIESMVQIDEEIINEQDKLWYFFYTKCLWSKLNHKLTPVIFIDQFEELFTKNDKSEIIKSFFDIIDSLQYGTPPNSVSNVFESTESYINLNDSINFRMIFSLREDFLPRLEDYSYDIAALRKNRKGIKRMNGLQALDVIQKPLPELVSHEVALHILSKVVGKTVIDKEKNLVLLAVDSSILSLFCSELFSALDKKHDTLDAGQGSNVIEMDDVNTFGSDIIEAFYNKTMSQVPPKTVEYLESHLITHSGFRNRVALEDIIQKGIKKEDLLLLNTKRIIRIESLDNVEWVEFSHDVLCDIAKSSRDARQEKESTRKEKLTNIFIYGQFFIESLVAFLVVFYCFYANYDLGDSSPNSVFGIRMIPLAISIIPFSLILKNIRQHKAHKSQNYPLGKILFFTLIFYLITLSPIDVYKDQFSNRFYVIALSGFILSTFIIILASLLFKIKRTKASWFFSGLSILSLFLFAYIRYSTAFGIFLLLFAVFILSPYKYRKKRQSLKMVILYSILIIPITFTFFSLGYSYLRLDFLDYSWQFVGLILLVNAILSYIFSLKEYDNKETNVDDDLSYCFTFKFYDERPILKLWAIFLAMVLFTEVSFIIGRYLNDWATLLIIPVIGSLVLLLVFPLNIKFGEIQMITGMRKNKSTRLQNNRFNNRIILFSALLSFCIILVFEFIQYTRWRIIWMIVIWGVALMFLLWLYNSILKISHLAHIYNIENARYEVSTECSKSNILFSVLIIGVFAFGIIPAIGCGYNVMSLPQYSRVLNGTVFSNRHPDARFITIKNANGKIGLRDRKNLVIPTSFDSIFLYRYVTNESTNNFYDSICYPEILFRTINNNKRDIWDCIDHLDMQNICTNMLLDELEKNLEQSLEKKKVEKYLIALHDRGATPNDIHLKAIQLLDLALKRYDIKPAIVHSKRKISFSGNEISPYKMYLCIDEVSDLFPYLNDVSIERRLIDTMMVNCNKYAIKNCNLKDGNKRNKNTSIIIPLAQLSEWRVKAKDYERAILEAEESLKIDASIHNPAKISLIEACFLSKRYQRAKKLLSLYINDDCFLGHAHEWYFLAKEKNYSRQQTLGDSLIYKEFLQWRDTLTNSDTYNERIFVGHAFFKELNYYKRMGVMISQDMINQYNILSSEFKQSFSMPIYDFAVRLGEGENYYYLCRHWDGKSDLKFYKFYIYNNQQVTPKFWRYSYSHDSRIIVIFDVETKKRYYVDFTTGIPYTISGGFEHAWPFYNNVAVVYSDGKCEAINNKGQLVDTPKYDYKLTYPKYFEFIDSSVDMFQSSYLQISNWLYNIAS